MKKKVLYSSPDYFGRVFFVFVLFFFSQCDTAKHPCPHVTVPLCTNHSSSHCRTPSKLPTSYLIFSLPEDAQGCLLRIEDSQLYLIQYLSLISHVSTSVLEPKVISSLSHHVEYPVLQIKRIKITKDRWEFVSQSKNHN